MNEREEILVLGGDSAIATALRNAFAQGGRFHCTATTRRAGGGAGEVHFDAEDEATWCALPEAPRAAFFCFGATSLEDCESHPRETRSVNVDAPLRLARQFSDRGTHVVSFSTSLVFEGRHPGSNLATERKPQGEYARQKADLEDALLDLPGKTSVLRVTKFLESLDPLIRRWAEDIRRGAAVQPFYDRLICPFDRDLLSNASTALIERERTGILHLSGEVDFSYHQLAAWLAKSLGAPAEVLDPISARGLALEPERPFPWPPWTALDMERSEEELGVRPTPLSSVRKHLQSLARGLGEIGTIGMEKSEHE